MMQYGELGNTFYFWFASNDTSGSGADGASAAADVRLAGASASAAPVYSPTPALLTHANYPAGAYEIEIPATAGNGFTDNNVYSIFATLAVSSQNPTGFVGAFALGKLQTAADFGLILETTISSIATQPAPVLTAGSSADNAYVGRLCTIQDADDPNFIDVVYISGYTGSTRTLSLGTVTSTFSAAVGDKVRIYAAFHPAYITVPSNVFEVNGVTITGTGVEGDRFRPV